MHLGAVGLFALAVVDSSMVPIPLPGSTDLVLLLLTAFRSSSVASPFVFASCALAGSIIGGYLAWAAGKKGGEAALEKLGKGRFVRRVQGWVKRNGILSVWLAAVQPPPIPLMPFTLAAGALGLSLPRFMIAYCTGRAARYGLIAWLGYKYGRQMLVWWQRDLKGWTTPILSVYIRRQAPANVGMPPIRFNVGSRDSFQDASIYYARHASVNATYALPRQQVERLLDLF